MMGDCLDTFVLVFLHRIIQEEVNQNGINHCLGMLPNYLPSNELDRPYATASQLQLPWMAAFNDSQLSNMGL